MWVRLTRLIQADTLKAHGAGIEPDWEATSELSSVEIAGHGVKLI